MFHNKQRKKEIEAIQERALRIDPFTVDRTGDSNGVFETMQREILDFRIFWLSSHIARFLCINVLEPDENLTGPTWVTKERFFSFRSF